MPPIVGEAAAPYEVYTSLLSHELRTPVTTIVGYLALLDDERVLTDTDTLRRYLGIIRGRAADLARLVSELTAFDEVSTSRGGAARGRAPVSLPALVEQFAGGLPVTLEVTPEAASAPVDYERLSLVLEQLLDNAFRHGAVGGEVRVSARLAGEPPRLVLRVINDGDPIPDELRPVIFQPFRQAEPFATRRMRGLGLGLAVARRAAEAAGGSLILEPGSPTCFRLELPLREDPLAQQARALRALLAAVQPAGAGLPAVETGGQARGSPGVPWDGTVETGGTQPALLRMLMAVAGAVEVRAGYPAEHVERVRQYSLALAARLQLSESQRHTLELGAILHDIGLIGVSDAILTSTGPLGPDERRELRRHPEIGSALLRDVAALAPVAEVILAHHERWDGQGYPRGLAGEQIPLLARIVAVADAYDTMTTDRPDRGRLSPEMAAAELERSAGAQFDPAVVTALLRHLRDTGGR